MATKHRCLWSYPERSTDRRFIKFLGNGKVRYSVKVRCVLPGCSKTRRTRVDVAR